MKKTVICAGLVVACLAGQMAYAQALTRLTLPECLARARTHYPMIRQLALIERTAQYSVENAQKSNLPQLTINGQATYQSEVTRVPVNIPGQEIPVLEKDQYRVYGELTQNLYNGGYTRNQKASAAAQAVIDEQQVEVDLYKLNERIQQIYFGILLTDGRLQQLALRRDDLQLGLERTEAAIANGVALRSNADVLRAELLTLQQSEVELRATRQAFTGMLGIFIGESLPDSVVLERPEPVAIQAEVSRPELMLYNARASAIDVQENMISISLRPRFNFFFQGGYGRPALNQLSNEFNAYYLTGIRFSWNLGALYTAGTSRQQLTLQRQAVGLQREAFLFNSNITLQQDRTEIEKYRVLLNTDDEIIALREQVKRTAAAQLANSVITANDYLREVNAEDQARQNKIIHEIQWLQAQYHHQYTTGTEQ